MPRRSNKNKNTSVRLFYPLLFICYLEVLLWTTTVLSASGVAATEDALYLCRETESLKLASLPRSPFAASPAAAHQRGVLPGAVDLRGGCPPPSNPAAQRDAERDALRSLASPAHLAASSASSPASSARDAAWAVLSLGCLPLLKGVPAPFAGVKSLSN